MADANLQSLASRKSEDRERAFEFRRQGQQAHRTIRSVEILRQQFGGRLLDLRRWMRAAALDVQEWALEMDAQRLGAGYVVRNHVGAVGRPYDFTQAFGGIQHSVQAGRNGSGRIGGCSVARQVLSDCRNRFGTGFHQVVTHSAVNVDVDESRNDGSVLVIDHRRALRNLHLLARPYLCNPVSFNQDYAILDLFRRSINGSGNNGFDALHGFPLGSFLPPSRVCSLRYSARAFRSARAVLGCCSRMRRASLLEMFFQIISRAAGRFDPAAFIARAAVASSTPVALATMERPRSRSFSFFISTWIINPENTRPSFTMVVVESMFNTSFWAVPAFRRVEPPITSGPTLTAISISASPRIGESGLAVTPMVAAPISLA